MRSPTELQRLLPFLRLSREYPRIREPAVKDGGAQERVMQSLEAASTLGGKGGPGNAAGFHMAFNINVQFISLLLRRDHF